jgi:hypothetical protein
MASYKPVKSGQYAVIVTKNGCTDTSDCRTVSIAGITEALNNRFSVYPNPAEDYVILEFESTRADRTLIVQDVVGNTCSEQKLIEGQHLVTLPEAPGIYFLVVQDPTGRYISRVVKK